jgi:hypothetical protein
VHKGAPLKVYNNLALKINELPHINAVLLSYENHPNNLNKLRQQLLDSCHVVTINNSAKNLALQPSVLGFSN